MSRAKYIKLNEGTRWHPWRLCPQGYYFQGGGISVAYHGSDEFADPWVSKPWRVRVKCKECGSVDLMDSSEMFEIAKRYFGELEGPPKKDALDFPNGNEFDIFIRGWTKYWNDIFLPIEHLDANLVKALIASESSFEVEIDNKYLKRRVKAMGLMQIRESTRRILGDQKGELRSHLLIIPRKMVYEPNVNICAGIRWMFRKKEIEQSKYKSKSASWVDVVWSYKGGVSKEQRNRFTGFYQRLSS